jgi:hypothetical protein
MVESCNDRGRVKKMFHQGLRNHPVTRTSCMRELKRGKSATSMYVQVRCGDQVTVHNGHSD